MASRYKDGDFPPKLRILFHNKKDNEPYTTLNPADFCFGQWRKKSLREISGLVMWVGIKSLEFKRESNQLFQDLKTHSRNTMDLFVDLVEADDVVQGKLGNCWFLASMGAVAEKYPSHIKSLFIKEPSAQDGRTVVRLYNPYRKKWEHVTIDDFIPVFSRNYLTCPKYTPLFARPNGLETWTILLEKAFAKFHGGYAYLKGGFARHAMKVLTGASIQGWVLLQENYWKRYDINYERHYEKECKYYPSERFNIASTPQRGHKANKDILKLLLTHHYKGNVCTCGFKVKGSGIITGHSYSFLNMFPKNSKDLMFLRANNIDFSGQELIQLRNPYGEGEWEGPWSDYDPKWSKYGKLKEYLGVCRKDDGVFWMDFASWKQMVSKIDICFYDGN